MSPEKQSRLNQSHLLELASRSESHFLVRILLTNRFQVKRPAVDSMHVLKDFHLASGEIKCSDQSQRKIGGLM